MLHAKCRKKQGGGGNIFNWIALTVMCSLKYSKKLSIINSNVFIGNNFKLVLIYYGHSISLGIDQMLDIFV